MINVSFSEIEGNVVHHCTSAGIICDQCDNTTIKNNVVYGNTWWTTSASSAVSFSEAVGSGFNSIEGNVVYANRNFMPFFLSSNLPDFGSGVPNYGKYNQYCIVDGQGIYVTRNPNFSGTFDLRDNKSWDNGINGLVVQKTTNKDVDVRVSGNYVFDNGKTRRHQEGRQDAGGITMNSGSEVSIQSLVGNVVITDSEDTTYQCFGTCELTPDSNDNLACGKKPSKKLDQSVFNSDLQCDGLENYAAQIKA